MQPHIIRIIAAGVILSSWGCASSRPKTTNEGQRIFTALQQAVVAASKKAEPCLALVRIERESTAPRSAMGGTVILGGASEPSSLNGIIMTKQGHVLVPGVIKPDQDNRITVLVGENEYVARALKAEENLGMSLLKLDSDDTFTAIDLSQGTNLAVGEWAIVLKPTDEDSDYQKLATPVTCQGEKAGRYRRFLLTQSLTSSGGALVVNLSGQVVGLMDRNSVLAISDLRDDLQLLVAETSGGSAPDDDRQKRGWFGATLEPVNKDYAKARKLSTSSLFVIHVAKNGPAASAGLHPGDWIVALNSQPLRFTGSRALEDFIKSLQPRVGQKFALTVLRNDKPVELAGIITKSPEPATLRAEDLGVTVAEITDTDVFYQNLTSDSGVLVTDVHRGSPAANSGSLRQTLISRRDIILELAGQPTPTLAAFSKALESVRRDHPPVVLIKYHRGLLTGYAGLNLTLGEKETGAKQ